MITTAIQNQDQHSVSLNDLADKINAKHGQTIGNARTTLESARDAGRLLITAKSEVVHGQWTTWLADNCLDISGRTARKYIQIAVNWEVIESKMAPEAILTIGSVLRLIADPREKSTATAESVAQTLTGRYYDIDLIADSVIPVSYTHLTLPTKA